MDKRFRLRLLAWQQAGVVDRWMPRSARWIEQQFIESEQPQPLWVGAPKMSSIAEHLSKDLDLRCQTQISDLQQTSRWNLFSESESLGQFDQIVLTCPAPQSRALLPLHLGDLIPTTQQLPQWALLLDFHTSSRAPLGSHPLQSSCAEHTRSRVQQAAQDRVIDGPC